MKLKVCYGEFASLSITDAAATASAADVSDDGDVARWRQENVPKLVCYFSDFTVDWAEPQMNQNIVYGADWTTRCLRLWLTYSLYASPSRLANACMRC